MYMIFFAEPYTAVPMYIHGLYCTEIILLTSYPEKV